MLDFTAIDFETANRHETSACSVGLAVVENGQIARTYHYFIRPYPFFFLEANIRVHGIEARDVQEAPSFADLWPTIRPLLDGHIIAAHYALFDMGVLLGGLDFYGIERPNLDILCSCRMARAAFPELSSHKLSNVCRYLSIPLNHHHADSDAEGSAAIIINIAQRFHLQSLMDVRRRLGLEPGSVRGGKYIPLKKWR